MNRQSDPDSDSPCDSSPGPSPSTSTPSSPPASEFRQRRRSAAKSLPSDSVPQSLSHKTPSNEVVDNEGSHPSQLFFPRQAGEPPFTLDDVRRAIPAECFNRSLAKSIFYWARDFLFVALAFAALYVARRFCLSPPASLAGISTPLALAFYCVLYPLYLFVQGTNFWAIFVAGHDCGHGSFSESGWANSFFGHIAHTFILVPYNSWRISHHLHHMNTGSIQHDHTFVPPTKSEFDSWNERHKVVRFSLFPFVGWAIYLAIGMHPVFESHFWPFSKRLYQHREDQISVAWSLLWWWTFVLSGLYFTLTCWGWTNLFMYYMGPWVVFSAWIAIVTHLHHTHPDIPWFRGDSWYYLRGALSTVDRNYGPLINEWHHNIGTHMVHHIFIKIPHYNLKKATEGVKPLFKQFYRLDTTPIFKSLLLNWRRCRFVDDTADACFYKA